MKKAVLLLTATLFNSLSSSAQTYDFKTQYENFEKQEKGDAKDLYSLQCVVC